MKSKIDELEDKLSDQVNSGIITEEEYYETLRIEVDKIRDRDAKKAQDLRDKFKQNNTQDECPVCLEALNKGDQIECGHYVHLECLKSAQRVSNKLYYECPCCKYELVEIEPTLKTESGEWIIPIDEISYEIKDIDNKLRHMIMIDSGEYWLFSRHYDKSKNRQILYDIWMNME